jgi:hypothetical protein
VICEHCELLFSKTSRYQRYCSKPCATIAREAREHARYRARTWRYLTRDCEWCGVPVIHRSGNPKRFCSDDCCQRAQWTGKSCPVPWRQCVECSQPFISRRKKKVCSTKCVKTRVDRQAVESYMRLRSPLLRPPTHLVCVECGQEYEASKHRDRTYCSKQCVDRASKRTRRHRIRTHPVEAERFTTREIAERDDWLCHLCDGEVSPEDWSIDHLVPVSKGGPHIRSNVRLAHKLCNSVRGAEELLNLSRKG